MESTSALARVLEDRSTPASQCSIIGVMTDSMGLSPKAGRSCEETSARYPVTVDGLHSRSNSM